MSNKKEQKKIKDRVGKPAVFTDLVDLSRDEKYLKLLQGLKIDFDFKNYPESLFFIRDETIVAQYNIRTLGLWLSQSMWIFNDDFIFEEDYDIQSFIERIFKDYFGIKVRPMTSNFRKFENFKK